MERKNQRKPTLNYRVGQWSLMTLLDLKYYSHLADLGVYFLNVGGWNCKQQLRFC